MAPKVERLVNLTIALLEARRPLTLAEIKRKTGFYGQEDSESARRMFERDKDDLRSLGVPVELRDVPFEDEPGYFVDRRDYELEDVALDADEVAALALAVRLTGAEGSKLTLTKLAARAPDPVGAPPQLPVRVSVDTGAVDAVADAVVDSCQVTFAYRTATGDTSERTVDPYAIVQRRGAWYLVGRDHARDALRTFRLDRMVGQPRLTGEPGSFDVPDDIDLADAVAGPDVHPVDVEVAVAPEARWAVESRGATATRRRTGVPDGWTPMRLTGFDPERDLAWLLGLGPDVVVLEPADVVTAAAEAFEAVAVAHGMDA